MEAFNKIVLGTAAIILILILVYIGIVMSYSKKSNRSFPPNVSTCPDYWKYDGTNCIPSTLKNTGNNSHLTTPTGVTLNNGSFNPKSTGWANGSSTALCNQRKWANANGLEWDGVTNYTGC